MTMLKILSPQGRRLIDCVLLFIGLATAVGADRERVDGRCMLQRSPPA